MSETGDKIRQWCSLFRLKRKVFMAKPDGSQKLCEYQDACIGFAGAW
jgi:hypothetical protein